jgi:arylsulfatase A-like enzyme/Flp pilus assembly protein TadD
MDSRGLSSTKLILAACLFVGLCLHAVPSSSVDKKTAGASGGQRTHPNVVLITIDTLRPDRLGVYGNRNGLTPRMDALAADGTVFLHTIAQVPLTLPSHTTLLTGTYPMWHGVRDLSTSGVGHGIPTLAEIFKGNGYRTGAFVSAFVLNASWGLNRGFDHYDDGFTAGSAATASKSSLERPAPATLDAALRWLKTNRASRFFLWIHFYDPHAPYTPPEPYKSRYENQPYDGEVAYVDSQIGRLVDALKEFQCYDSTVVALTSDHGEALGEHNEEQHGYFVYNATVKVPLILKQVGSKIADRSETVATLVDVAPTLLHAAGYSPATVKPFQGKDLLSSRAGDAKPPLAYAESLYPSSSFGWHSLRSVQNDRYHYIETTRPELYDLSADPGELRNIVHERQAVAAVLKQDLAGLESRYQASGNTEGVREADPERARKLQALGYVGGAVRPVAGDNEDQAPDPKDKIALYGQILRATELTEDKRFSEADAVLGKISAENPDMFLLSYLRAENLFASGATHAAVPYYKKALELNPKFDLAAMGLGHAAFRAGEDEQAIAGYRKALALNSRNFLARLALAKVYTKLKRFPEAAEEQKAVLDGNPQFQQAQVDYGSSLLAMKRFDQALVILRKAAQNPEANAETHYLLGNAYAYHVKFSEAAAAYQRAIAMDQNYAPAYAGLALVYYKTGDRPKFELNGQKACQLDSQLCGIMHAQRP